MDEAIKKALQRLANEALSEERMLECLCSDPTCAKCLLINCKDETCKIHPEENKQRFRERYKHR